MTEQTKTPPKNARAAEPAKPVEAPAAVIPRSVASLSLPSIRREDLGGHLIVIEGTDGSGRSTQMALLTEWLESQGFAVQTMGLRRSALIGRDIDALLARNVVTRYTLPLM